MAVSPVGTFFIVFFVLLVVAAAGWVVFTQLRARRLGLPSPPLSSYITFTRSSHQSYGQSSSGTGGIRAWLSDKFRTIKNPRSAAGAYEPSGATPGGRRGFGPLDPDEAWDARVGHEAYGVGAYQHEDQELEDRTHIHYGGGGGGGGGSGNQYSGLGYQSHGGGGGGIDGIDEENRGRNPTPRPSDVNNSTSRSAYMGAGHQHNPFDDVAAEPSNMSLRGGSPRGPFVDTRRATLSANPHVGPTHDSPTSVSERRSVFREEV
ncbi:hypothetical protein GGR50DRAFT_242174 [Xylaria sp. CBS 124048]|nr:hypothetical protein GGR50DRAFT_242174 [Xylaria sp. CBS 124048]